jgi:hypothetical protein
MQHVTRLCGSRLRLRTILRTNYARFFRSTSRLGEEVPKPIENHTRTLRSRFHGNTALPVSALFDPVTVAAREKHKQPKPLPPAEWTEFQRELAQNVYGITILSFPDRVSDKSTNRSSSSSSSDSSPTMCPHKSLLTSAFPYTFRYEYAAQGRGAWREPSGSS